MAGFLNMNKDLPSREVGDSNGCKETKDKKSSAFYDDNSSESDDEEELDITQIFTRLFQYYPNNDDTKENLIKTSAYLEGILHSGAATCLICIGSIRRVDKIWSCRHCYCILHLNCISRWANDSIAQAKKRYQHESRAEGYYNSVGEFVPPKAPRPIRWCCPQCRHEYKPDDRPAIYTCFCGKTQDPEQQPWVVPHSCGEVCEKNLRPECGHKCMMLCHPGPCPPCAQTITVSCQCQQSPTKTIRCIDRMWTCNRKCLKRLPTCEHSCHRICHKPGPCPPCIDTSVKACDCGSEVKVRTCSNPSWHCEKVCNKPYTCGKHQCKKVCHRGSCGDCPLGMERSCPCGKSRTVGSCLDPIESCGDTCQKMLPCGKHTCTQRCHQGPCNLCYVIIKKKCRCGMHEKDMPCCKEFTCETKCKKMRDCGKHACNKKCCNGECTPCDKVCGKLLSCRRHKCESICHDGPCYPCERKSKVRCRCGKTTQEVPCGRERSARVVCMELCRNPTRCHHPNKHRCHKSECPPCNQKCGLPNTTSGCGHLCEARCHSAVKKTKKPTPGFHGGLPPNRMFEYVKTPHPRCEKLVPVTCHGGHETADFPCHEAKPFSCLRPCDRLLACGNHRCTTICHPVPDKRNKKAQESCMVCDNACILPRPYGCKHPCPKPCHQPPCDPCNFHIKTYCHCGINQVVYKCSAFYDISGTEEEVKKHQEALNCCGNRCLKNYKCGHRCLNLCHSGDCLNAELCRKKVRIYCPCKRIKIEVGCDKIRAGFKAIECDDACVAAIQLVELQKKEKEERIRQEEEKKNRIELEQFEKKFSKRKPKERKPLAVKEAKQLDWMTIAIYISVALAIIVAIAVAFYEVQ